MNETVKKEDRVLAPAEVIKEELIAKISLMTDEDCADIIRQLRKRGVLV